MTNQHKIEKGNDVLLGSKRFTIFFDRLTLFLLRK